MTETHSPRRVVIIGGGLAGLAAAEGVANAARTSVDVLLIEAKRVVGGRAGSFTDATSGQAIDYCQHVAMGCCANLISLLKRSGQLSLWRRDAQLTFLHPDAPASRFWPLPWIPAPLHLAPVIGQLRYLRPLHRREITRGLWRLMRTPSLSLNDRTAAQWLASQGQSPQTMKLFWDVILVSALGETSDRVSMTAARKVFIDGFAATRKASNVLIPTRPLSELFGHKLPAYLQSLGIELRTMQTVRCLRASTANQAEQAAVVELATGERISADHVILATAWAAAAKLIEESELRDSFPDHRPYAELPSSPITGVHLWLDRAIMNRRHATLVNTLPQWIFRSPVEQDGSPDEHYYQVVISASHDVRGWAKPDLIAQILSDLGRVLPLARSASVLRYKVVTDPNSVFSVRPEVDAIRPAARTPLPWLSLAGDWTATGWPATMEGAVISGRLAANEVSTRFGYKVIQIEKPQPGPIARLLIRP